MVFDLNKLVRENVKRLISYSSARDEYNGSAQIFLDANENSFGSPLPQDYNRYPDPKNTALKEKIATLNGIDYAQIFIGNGSDEVIDLLIRLFCRPGVDDVLICPPTYGMYEVAAGINDAGVVRVNLTDEFELDSDAICKATTKNTKLVFLCSPNNPTGNSLSRNEILNIAKSFVGVVVVDEAYVHFSDQSSLVSEIAKYPNLVILQTFSKAWGLAGLRVGVAFANRGIVELLNRIKPPYNVSTVAQDMTMAALKNQRSVEKTIAEIKRERGRLADGLLHLPFVKIVYPSDANFLLIKVENADDVYRFLVGRRIVVRDRSKVVLCAACLRITVGTPDENRSLLNALTEYRAEIKSNA